MGISYMENRDRNMVGDVAYQRWNSDIEFMKNGISDVMELR